MKTQRFGIEIEMTGITREEAAIVLARYFNSQIEYSGRVYDAYQVLDEKARSWNLVRDGSIQALKKNNGKLQPADRTYSVELVSPILTYEDIEPLQEIIRELRKAGAVSSSEYGCGIHVHIDASPHTPNSLKNLVNLMASKEDLLYKSLNTDARRMRYLHKIRNTSIFGRIPYINYLHLPNQKHSQNEAPSTEPPTNKLIKSNIVSPPFNEVILYTDHHSYCCNKQ